MSSNLFNELRSTSTDNKFPDPFCDIASTRMPKTIQDVHYLCEMLWLTNDTYRMAASRIVRYFLTRIELTGASDSELRKYEEFLNKQLRIMEYLAMLGDDFMCYGNSLSSVYIPFKRILSCPNCGFEVALDVMEREPQFKLEFVDFKFKAYCPKCHKTDEWDRMDRRLADEKRIRIIRWSPHEIEMLHHMVSHESSYLWRIPEDFQNQIRKGIMFYVKDTPWEIVEAIKNKSMLKFHPETIFHMREPTLAGVRNYGWGISRVLSSFKQAWYVQVLKRYNEAIALDYVVPFRVISPAQGTASGDPLAEAGMGSFRAAVQQMIQEHRRDPAMYHAFPFPINYQTLGGEAKQLAPVELLTQGQDELLTGIGIPVELYKGTLQLQAAPTALRLFQATWPHLVSNLNAWIRWVLSQISLTLNWEEVEGELQPSTLADDLERRMIQMQLAAANQISLETALRPLNIDPYKEIDRAYQERAYRERKEQEYAQRMMQEQQAMSGGGPQLPQDMTPAMGMALPPPSGAPAGITPDALNAQADQIAQQLFSMNETARKSTLIQLKRNNETLHALVKSKLEGLRQQARSQGYQAVMQQVQMQPPM